MKTVAQLIGELAALPQDLPVVVTIGIGDHPKDPEPEEREVVFDADDDPIWASFDGALPDGYMRRKVVWL